MQANSYFAKLTVFEWRNQIITLRFGFGSAFMQNTIIVFVSEIKFNLINSNSVIISIFEIDTIEITKLLIGTKYGTI